MTDRINQLLSAVTDELAAQLVASAKTKAAQQLLGQPAEPRVFGRPANPKRIGGRKPDPNSLQQRAFRLFADGATVEQVGSRLGIVLSRARTLHSRFRYLDR